MSENNNIQSLYSFWNFCNMLTVLFIGLKLANIINWSWWWVLSPQWIPAVFVFVVGLFILIFVKMFVKNE